MTQDLWEVGCQGQSGQPDSSIAIGHRPLGLLREVGDNQHSHIHSDFSIKLQVSLSGRRKSETRVVSS